MVREWARWMVARLGSRSKGGLVREGAELRLGEVVQDPAAEGLGFWPRLCCVFHSKTRSGWPPDDIAPLCSRH